ncbi:flagellar protein FlaG [Haloimpatiens sp. FM7330]|uniref:flagellar protein FlaG n=1 Tax=Haloimpatiens sp. FM7330 TaxID=3298610 RepID=UPI003636857B
MGLNNVIQKQGFENYNNELTVGTEKNRNVYNNSDSVYLKQVSEKDVRDVVDGINKLIKDTATHIEYEKHDKFNEYIIKIVDNETKEVVKEIPPKKILDMVAKMCEMIGILVDEKA